MTTAVFDRLDRVSRYLGMRERLDASPRLDGATRRELLLATAGLVVAVAILLHKQVLNRTRCPTSAIRSSRCGGSAGSRIRLSPTLATCSTRTRSIQNR